MDILKKVKEYDELEKKKNRIICEVNDFMASQAEKMTIHVKEIEIERNYEEILASKDYRETRICYYPVLDLPTGYIKENEVFYLDEEARLFHEYVLKDKNNRKFKITENAHTSEWNISNDYRVYSNLVNFLLITEIEYIIDGTIPKFSAKRKFDYEEMLYRALELRNLKIKDSSEITRYEKAEKSYKEYVKRLIEECNLREKISEFEISKHINDGMEEWYSLREIVESSKERIQIAPYIIVRCKHIRGKEKARLKLEIDGVKYIQNVIIIYPYRIIDSYRYIPKVYEYWEIEE